MNNIFYCPQCKEIKTNLEYKPDQITYFNPRDGYGRPITHIICPYCKYELAGVINMRGIKNKDIFAATEYYKSVIEGYSDGTYCDSKELLKMIKRK